MGSSGKKKKEKQKDFQVNPLNRALLNNWANRGIENKIESWQGESKGGQLHGHKLQIKM